MYLFQYQFYLFRIIYNKENYIYKYYNELNLFITIQRQIIFKWI